MNRRSGLPSSPISTGWRSTTVPFDNNGKIHTSRRALMRHLWITPSLWFLLFGVSVLCGGLFAGSVIFTRYHKQTAVPKSAPQLYGMMEHNEVSYQGYLDCLKDPNCDKYKSPTNSNNTTYPHDYPGHPWHWTRVNAPDATLDNKRDCQNNRYRDLYEQFHQQGFVIFQSCSMQATVLDKVEEYTATIPKAAGRVQTAPVTAVKELAADPDTLEFVRYLHGGRRPFPFQTLNFPTGTQQGIHSDLIHFDTMPRTLMSAAWVALEDMNDDNGPLRYFPGSHHWGTWDYDEIGLTVKGVPKGQQSQEVYSQELERLAVKAGLEEQRANTMKKGQSLIWAAGLLHGGAPQNNPALTRKSQVTHYYFEGAQYYWVPHLSDIAKGEIFYRDDAPRCTSADYAPKQILSCADEQTQRFVNQVP
ncbi:Phytanoyl-CoA dioxygenase (PhyH) [Seminavis robusta]|uniref:Phytanoyl-CoA dioxygenase (PhyH) n=1 Tax=Seminavis robusta TaxID=568900 RepID=A0A9N8HC24_9STRA|nr:Phytanoyl-CoA dioxygenase (PhyH) [Seminavis robusta]|eukprot:Sro389_g132600.1 Phytanoyl-CoA dioxygenase (PhyH) (417) ;mRNA; f:34006-35348